MYISFGLVDSGEKKHKPSGEYFSETHCAMEVLLWHMFSIISLQDMFPINVLQERQYEIKWSHSGVLLLPANSYSSC